MGLGTQNSDPSSPTASAIPAKKSWGTTINEWFEHHWLLGFNTGWGVFTLLPWLAPILMVLGLYWPGRAVYFIYNFFCHQLPERSWFLFGQKFTYTQAEIAAAWGRTLPEINNELIRRQFIGTPEIGWKVAWSDRMVAMYTTIFLFGLVYAVLRERGILVKGLHWSLFLLLILPMALDGTTHLINDALRLDFRHYNDWAVYLTGGIFPPKFYVGDLFGSLNSVLRLVSGALFGFAVVFFLWPIMQDEFSPR